MPQMPPMPKGVTSLEDLERQARASGQTPPPGFARLGPQTGPVSLSHETSRMQNGTFAAPAAAPSPPRSAQATPPGFPSSGASNVHTGQASAGQDSGKTLLNLLSKVSVDAPREQPQMTAVIPPPGCPPSSNQASISWGASPQLQGIWGAPGPSSSGAQATWGAPLSTTPRATPSAAQPSQGNAGEQAEMGLLQQSQPPFTAFSQAARMPPGGLADQPGSANREQASAAAVLGLNRRASSGPVQPDIDGRRDFQFPNHASDPLLAMLGQHRSSAAPGNCFVPTCVHDHACSDILYNYVVSNSKLQITSLHVHMYLKHLVRQPSTALLHVQAHPLHHHATLACKCVTCVAGEMLVQV